MRSYGFTNRELEMMSKDNPAKALGLPVTQRTVSEVAGPPADREHGVLLP
jgi:hypothetical protein